MIDNLATNGSSATRRREGMPTDDDAQRKKVRNPAKCKWEIYHNLMARVYPGWENEPQPWSATVAMKYVNFPHFDRLLPESSHEHHCKSKDAKYNQIQDLETKWTFFIILKKISNLERWPKNAIPKCIASMKYAEHVLRMTMDWSTLQ